MKISGHPTQSTLHSASLSIPAIGSRILLSLMIITGASFIAINSAVATSPHTVVINEIMYHPSPDNDSDEFLELHNYGTDPVDMSGWCFTSGITLCFSSGTTIAPDDYAVISPNADETLNHYGVTTIGTYTGSLSNSGEKIKLVDASSTTVNSFTYSDHGDWPTSPDGSGPSLELKDPLLDNSLASSWSASLSALGTPGTINSITNANLPIVSGTTQPQNVTASDDETITATISNAITENLVYKIGFDDDVTIPMFDDGNHGDGAAGDGVFGATIPHQTSGALVRYRVEAVNGNGTTTSPSNDDTIHYYGYAVDSQTDNQGVPIIQWFISDSDYDSLINNPAQDNTEFPCVIVYGNEVFDNAQIRLKGNFSRTFAKKPFKVDLPQGHYLDMPGISKYPVNEFHLNTDFPNGNQYILSMVSWKIYQAAGFTTPNVDKVQINRNGNFEGSYLFTDKYGKEFDNANPQFKTMTYYDAWNEQQTGSPSDDAIRDAWKSNELNLTGDVLHQYIMDNNNIPNLINYLAASAVDRSHDWSGAQNLEEFYDKGNTDRWSVQPWDLDLTFSGIPFTGDTADAPQGYGYMIDPHDIVNYLDPNDRFMFNVIWNDPVLKTMYQRRVRTLVDQLYVSGQITTWADQALAQIQPLITLDYAKWGTSSDDLATFAYIRDLLTNTYHQDINDPAVIANFWESYLHMTPSQLNSLPTPLTSISPPPPEDVIYGTFHSEIPAQAASYTSLYVSQGLIPTAQPADPTVNINEVMYNPTGGNDDEYLELHNPNSYAVDMSGWTINGIGYTLPGGSVLPANGYGIVVKNDLASRTFYGGNVLVLGQYSGSLSDSGETISLVRDDSTVASSVDYGTDNPWPASANGQGRSLARNETTGCWEPSAADNGTPGIANTTDSSWDAPDTTVTCPAVEETTTTTTTTTTPPTTTTTTTPLTQTVKAVIKKSETHTTGTATTTTTTSTSTTTTTTPAVTTPAGKASGGAHSETKKQEASAMVHPSSKGLPLTLPLTGAVVVASTAGCGLFLLRPRWLLKLLRMK